MELNNIQSTTNKYIFKFIIPVFILLSAIYLIIKNGFIVKSFGSVFIISAGLVFLLLAVSIWNFESGLLVLLFLTCVINSLPVIILKKEILYPIILFAFLGFVLGARFKAFEIEMEPFYKDSKFRIFSIFIIFFTITITVSYVFTVLNNFNLFNFKNLEMHIYNINVIGASSLDALLFSTEMYLNYIITFILLFLLIKKLKITELFLKKLFYTLAGANIAVFTVFMYQIFVNSGFGSQPHWIPTGQINSTMINPNSFGFFLIINIGIFTAFLFYLEKKQKILCMIILFILPFEILYTGSRTALIGAAIFAALVVFYFLVSFLKNLAKNGTEKKNDLLVIATVLILLIIVPLLFSVFVMETDVLDDKPVLKPSLLGRINKNLEQTKEEDAVARISTGRNLIWPQAINAIKDYPLVGAGMGIFPLELSNYIRLSGFDLEIIDYPLNTYLQVLSENGIFAFIFFTGIYITLAAIIFNNLKRINDIKNKKFLTIIIFIIITCLIMFIFISGTNYYEGQLLYSFLLILLLLLSYKLKIKHEKI